MVRFGTPLAFSRGYVLVTPGQTPRPTTQCKGRIRNPGGHQEMVASTYCLLAELLIQTLQPLQCILQLPSGFLKQNRYCQLCQSFKATSPRTKLFSLSPFPLLLFPQHLTIQLHLSLSQPQTVIQASHALTVHIYMHAFSPQDRKLNLPLFPSPSLGIPPFCQCLQTTGQSNYSQSLRNVH